MKKITKYLLSIVCLLLLLTGCNKNNKTNNENQPNNNNELNNNQETNNNNDNDIENNAGENLEITSAKKGHTLNSSIGTFIVDKDGSVYYENRNELTYMGMTYKLTVKDLSVLGTKKEYKNYTYQSDSLCNLEKGCTIEAYKLNLTNVKSAYEVEYGNGGTSGGIIFITYDGKVHELSFNLSSDTKLSLKQNISKYPNIVSVVKNMQFGGHGSMLIDVNGNKYDLSDTNNTNNPVKKGHTLNSSIGNFIVDKDGSVYYENYNELTYMGMTYKLTVKDLSVLGTKKEYTNYTYHHDPLCDLEKGCPTESYKLNLTNISSAYEVSFGNGGTAGAIIFISYDGQVHELSFLLGSSSSTIKLTPNVSKYPNIVSVVKNAQFGGHGAMLIDSNGNKYDYAESKK